jgi:putative acetyltransferase
LNSKRYKGICESEYYPCFGFKPPKPFGNHWEIDVSEDVFMIAELRRGELNGRIGMVRYYSAFKSVYFAER